MYETSPVYLNLELRHAINSKVQKDINAVLKILALSINLNATTSRKNWAYTIKIFGLVINGTVL
jgi:hypothetical protein